MNRAAAILWTMVAGLMRMPGAGVAVEPVTIDRQKLVSGADLNYDRPASRPEEGMPVGNGRMGSLVWTTPSALRFQINRADVFAEHAASTSFPRADTDYASGCGYVDINLVGAGADVFADDAFRQHLSVYDGLMTAQGNRVSARAAQPKVAASGTPSLPGKELAQHPFLYCGEWQERGKTEQTMQIVRDGKVVWSYSIPAREELGDCTRISNGNIVFSRRLGASEITPDKKIVWNYEAPPATEIHTAYPIGLDRVLIMQNGNPARLLVINKRTNQVEKDLVLPTRNPQGIHGQFRHVRRTNAGTFLVAHMDLGKVVEYSADGQEIWSVPAPSAWAAVRLKNGNTLISGNQHGDVREVNRAGETVWEVNKNDLPGIPLYTVQEVSRFANGNTLINNWAGSLPLEEWPAVVQLIEITPEKKVVWALRDWKTLGPASSTQLLDEAGVPENGDLQR